MSTFIIDCPICKAKVAAEQKGMAENGELTDEGPVGDRLYVGACPKCKILLAAESHQVDFEGWNADEDKWSDCVRIYPNPTRTFSSRRIPRTVKFSLIEADKSLQAGAYTAACVMFGRALEALCRDILQTKSTTPTPAVQAQATPSAPVAKVKKIMLAEGIRRLKEKKLIDERLFAWSQQLQAFRNVAAHPEEFTILREDAEDLQSFAYAIVEYIYDLTDRYAEFQARLAERKKSSN